MKNNNQHKNQTINLELGKIPPQSVELEEVVLGAMMIDSSCVEKVLFILHADCFYKETHRLIFEAIYYLFKNKIGIDLKLVANQLLENGNLDLVGGDMYLVELTQKVTSSYHIEFHSAIIKDRYIKRKLIAKSSEIIQMAYDDTVDTSELIGLNQKNVLEITEEYISDIKVNFNEVVEGVITKGVKIYEGEITAGLPTPITEINTNFGGFGDKWLIIIAGRPGMGKTTFVLSVAKHLIKQNISVGMFSLEMSVDQLTTRLLSQETKVPLNNFIKNGLDAQDLIKIGNKTSIVKEWPIHIDDTSLISLDELSIKARRMKTKHGIKLLIVDYLQLMGSSKYDKSQNREQQISSISRGLKALAKDLKIPVIALSQLSRGVESRGGSKRPLLSDLRESGAIEQDADVVSFIYRPEYYGLSEWDDRERSPCGGQAEFIVAKNRHGALSISRMAFISYCTLFTDLEQKDYVVNSQSEFFDIEEK